MNWLRCVVALACAICVGHAAQTNISIGTAANDGTGDTLRSAFIKVNTNFTEVYTALNNAGFLLIGNTNSTLSNAVVLAAGSQVYLTTNGSTISINAVGGEGGGSFAFDAAQFTITDATNVFLSDGTRITNAVLLTPTIASFANATHTHQSAAAGGTLDAAAIASGTIADARIASTVTRDTEWNTSAKIAIAVDDETGSGALVFGSLPTITYPILDTPTITDFTYAKHNHSSDATGGTLAGSYQPASAALTNLSNNPLIYQATNVNLTALASNPNMYQATNTTLTTLAALGPNTWQATNATLTALVANPNRYQATNTVLTTLAALGPNTWQATNANLTALSAYGPTTWQATNANLTAWAALDPDDYSAGGLTEASASLLYQKTNSALTALATTPTMYQATNATLTTLSGKSVTGSGNIVLATSPTLVAPYITDSWVNANHNHSDASTGGQLGAAALNPAASYTMGTLDVTGALTSDSLEVTNAVTIGGTITTASYADLDAEVGGKMDSTVTASDITEGSGRTWAEPHSFDDLTLSQPASYGETNITANTLTLDWESFPKVNLTANADVTVSLLNLPDEGTKKWRTIWVTITNSAATNIAYTGPELATSRTYDDPSAVVAERILDLWFVWDGTNVTYDWKGPQDTALSVANGGTGNEYGVATAPYWVTYTPSIYTATNVDVDFATGTRPRLDVSTNIHLNLISGFPTTSGLLREQRWRITNTNASSEVYLTFNPAFNLIGFAEPDYITNGHSAVFNIYSEGSSVSNVYVENMLASVGTVAGGGEAPASSLFDDILANWKFEETSGSTAADSVGSLDLAELNGAWTKNVAGINSVAWTNVASTRVLTNSSTSLELGRSGASFTIAGWIWPNAVDAGYLFGEYHDTTPTADFSWCVRTSAGGLLQFYASSNGTSLTTFTSTFTITASRQLIAAKFDNTNNLIGLSINGAPWETKAFSGDMFDAAINFSIGGVFVNGAPSGTRGQYDEITVWDVALSDAQISEYYNGGAGTFYSP